MDSAHNKVQVYIRVRPYAYDYEVDMEKNKEIKEGVKCIIQLRNVEEVNNNNNKNKSSSGQKSNSKVNDNDNKSQMPNTVRLKNVQDNTFQNFTFNKVFNSFVPKTAPSYATQNTIWKDANFGSNVIENMFNGYNINILAYGETGSGKSYTLNGAKNTPGLISNLSNDMFDRINKEKGKGRGKDRYLLTRFVVEVSMYEIYDENIIDLLNPDNIISNTNYNNSDDNVNSLKTKQHPRHGLYIKNLTKTCVNDVSSLNAMINRGRQIQTIYTMKHLNDHTRKHTIVEINFTKIIENTELDIETDEDYFMNIDELSSTISIIDLAGSDRGGKLIDAETDKMFSQTNVNTSINSFQHVVKIISQNNTVNAHKPLPVPYRNSTLTKIIKNCFGGNSHTYVFGTIAPSNLNYLETFNTLTFLSNVRFIRNRAVPNKNKTYRMIKGLNAEMIYLMKELNTTEKKLKQEIETKDGGSNNEDDEESSETGESKFGNLTIEEKAKNALDKREKILKLELYKSKLNTQMEEDVSWLDELNTLDEEKSKISNERIQKQIDVLFKYGLSDSINEHILSRTPHLISLHKDAINISNKFIYLLPKGETTIGLKGTSNTSKSCDISVNGLKVDNEHCTIKNDKGNLIFLNGLESKSHVNGKLITLYEPPKTPGAIPRKAIPPRLKHNDRLILGNDVVFLVQIPEPEEAAIKGKKKGKKQAKEEKESNNDISKNNTNYDWYYAIKELFDEDLAKYTKAGLKDIKVFETKVNEIGEKMDKMEFMINEGKVKLSSAKGIEAEKIRTRRKQLEKRLEDELTYHKTESTKCDLYKRRFNNLLTKLYSILPLLVEGKTYLNIFDKKNLDFQLKVFDNDVYIELIQPSSSKKKKHNIPVVWNHDKFILRLHLMRQMYNEYMYTVDTKSNKRKSISTMKIKYRKTKDPFSDYMQHQLLGRSLIYLDSLSYFLDFEDTIPLIDYRGNNCGSISIKIAPISVNELDLQLNSIHDEGEKNIKDFTNQLFKFNVHIISAQSLPEEMCSNVYAQFKFPSSMDDHDDDDGTDRHEIFKTEACGKETKNPSFPKSTFLFEKKITPSFCHLLSKESVEVEVYGAPIGSKHDNPLKFSKKETNEIVTMTEEEMYRINVENLENSLIQERIMSEENKIVMEDLGKQVQKLKTRIRNSGGNADDDGEKYKVQNNDLKRQLEQMKNNLKMKEEQMKTLEKDLKSSKSKGCVVQ